MFVTRSYMAKLTTSNQILDDKIQNHENNIITILIKKRH